MKVSGYAVSVKTDPGGDDYISLRIYVKAAPTGGGTPSRVFEMTADTAMQIGESLMGIDL